MFNFLPHSVLQMSAIFLSIVIEAIPFVLLGCIISGALQVFLTPERVRKILPNNKFLAILVGSFLGFFFPSCTDYQSDRFVLDLHCLWQQREVCFAARDWQFDCCSDYWLMDCLF